MHGRSSFIGLQVMTCSGTASEARALSGQRASADVKAACNNEQHFMTL
ncbi:Unknown protein sequence [Pseudomonas coronafaciens pv. oryzae]|nr:Unknown protein sequence [Pseudomonas coronafaciens pv. oryzae]